MNSRNRIHERIEFQTLLGALPDAIVGIDSGFKPIFCNQKFEELFNDLLEFDEIRTVFSKAIESGKHVVAQGIPIPIKNTSISRYFSISVTPLQTKQEGIYGAVGVFHDVTELKIAEKIRIDFVGNVSHELRTPLTAIKGYTDTLRADFKDRRFETAEKFLDVISRNTERLFCLINDLLDLSSLESTDAAKVTKSEVDTREMTERVLSQIELKRAERHHEVLVLCPATKVWAEPARLEQVLTNLLDNAFKYTPARGKVEVRWEETKTSTTLTVRDNGPGIAPTHLPRLFERFYRVDEARSRNLGGTGLGLAIVKHILQRHDGTVSVHSEAGQGTHFICVFPTPNP